VDGESGRTEDAKLQRCISTTTSRKAAAIAKRTATVYVEGHVYVTVTLNWPYVSWFGLKMLSIWPYARIRT